MTVPGILAFLGLAVITVDVLGGVIAMGMLLRGGRVRHLLAFLAGYTVVVVGATLVLHPLLEILDRWLRPILESNDAIGSIEVVVGLALAGFAIHQARAATRPPTPHGRLENRSSPTRLSTVPLLLAGVAFSITALADPSFTIAVGMAAQEQNLPLRIALLVLWNVVYQAPLVAVTLAAVFGRHERLVERVMELFGPRRRLLQRILAGVLAAAALAVLADGVIALAGEHVPWLRQLILLR
jgi:cytochrome c biogenesis protein CcdA